MSDDSFLRLQARTARFTLGRPRSFTVSSDGGRVLFLRSRGGTDRVTCLWVYNLATDREVLLADPLVLLAGDDDALPASERARRERAREQAAGIVGYACDASTSVVAFALSGRLFVVDVMTAAVRELDVRGPVFDPRPDPTAQRVAYASAGAGKGELRVVSIDGTGDTAVADEQDVSWGVAEFVAAEEMNRQRGYWWSPDGGSILAARVDESAVPQWHIGDPANPERPPNVVRYPAAGTTNAAVSLALITLDGDRTDVAFDAVAFPYVVTARWRQGQRPLVLLASRDQRTMRIVEVDPRTGETAVVHEDHDAHWLEVVDGVPDRLPDGRLVTTRDVDDTRRLVVGDELVTPPGLQVRGVLSINGGDVLFSASTEPTETQLWGWFGGIDEECLLLTPEPGVHGGAGASDVLVVSSASLEFDGVRTVVRKNGVQVAEIASFAEPAPFSPSVSISRQGRRELRTALVLPRGHVSGHALPVLMDPYGGPHAQRVLASRGAYLNAQWLADQGFAVVIVDGRGTPGRGTTWEKAIAGDFATAVLEDQVEGLQSLGQTNPDLDLSRVAIRGWSFGGYLAALAVLRRPDVFHAAVAGAPVTDWSLYDTFYTERYLGTDTSAAAYTVSSLIGDAPNLTRPLMIVHGLADDNVVAAHTLRLSAALLAAGRPHSVLPLAGVTHMTSQEDVAANLVKLEVQFLRNALGLA